jgi:MFS family permease
MGQSATLRRMVRRPIPPAVWLLGWVSLLTDAASEAIYPLLPFFLTTVLGSGPVALGLIEGVAEGTNSLLRIVSGRLSDRTRGRRRLVIAGYTLSSAARPLIALVTAWWQVLVIRFTDRIGKGVRSAPRDALLAYWAAPGDRGRLYGFHRAMDHSGAVVGPLVASAFLLAAPGQYRTLFLLTAIPGAVAVALVWRVRDVDAGLVPGIDAMTASPAVPGGDAPPANRRLPRSFWAFAGVVGIFTLGNSTDAFLLLRLTDAAGGPALIPLMWALLHVVKAGLSTPGGGLSDRVGRKPVLAASWLVYALVYAGFAFSESFVALTLWLLVYGVHFALAEGTEKAMVADLAPAALRGTAFGIFHAIVGVGSLAASVVFGLVWNTWGAPAAFGLGAALAMFASVLLFTAVRTEPAPSADVWR